MTCWREANLKGGAYLIFLTKMSIYGNYMYSFLTRLKLSWELTFWHLNEFLFNNAATRAG